MKEQNQHNEYFLADWLAGHMSDAELRALVGDDAFDDYVKIRQAGEVMQDLSKPIAPVWEQIASRMDEKQKPKVRPMYAMVKKILPYAAILLVMFGIFKFFDIKQITVQTAMNEQKIVWLPNGAQVILHDKASLTYTPQTWQDNPEIFIEGNAFVKNHINNIFVRTHQGRIAISNASIELYSDDTLLEIFTYKGKILTLINGQETVVIPNSKFVFENDLRTISVSTKDAPVWLTNISRFNDVPLAKVIDSLEVFYHITIDRDAINTEQKFSGSVPKYDLKLALRTVFKPMQIKYKLQKNHIVLTEKKSDNR